MALEEQIVAWACQRPAWQREIMLWIAQGKVLSDSYYDRLIEDIVASVPVTDTKFELEHMPAISDQAPSIRINSIASIKHVNALASHQPLTFAPCGLSIVYGDNGSGKSGYARLLKRITRARHQEEVLSDVFRDTASDKPSACLDVSIGGQDTAVTWPETAQPELQRMHFYDRACMKAYISTESDFPYRPAELDVMHGLISACVTMRERIGHRLSENAQSKESLPTISEEAKDTEIGQFLKQLSGSTTIEGLDKLLTPLTESPSIIDEIRTEENRLRNADSGQEQQYLMRQADKFEALHKHIEVVHKVLGNDGLARLQASRGRFKQLQEASTKLAQAFESEPLPGVGGSPWQFLWEAAKRFSVEEAYPDRSFPFVEEESRCVLCHQILEPEGQERLRRFEDFIKDDHQVKLDEARQVYDTLVGNLTEVPISTEAVEINLRDLESSHAEQIRGYEELLDRYQKAQETAFGTLSGTSPLVFPDIEPADILAQLAQAAAKTRQAATDLGDRDAVKLHLAQVTARRQELDLLQDVFNARETITREIQRLQERTALEEAKNAAATGPITRKISEFTEEAITEVVRDQFTRETERLQLQRVTLESTRASRGTVLHKPKLVSARQKAQLPRVFSEGERSALGLAAFFTQAELDASQSTLILDDPVTSLDHIRRGKVAKRLATLAAGRQVIVFTHEVAFVAELQREAAFQSVPVSARWVSRSRSAEGMPGTCSTDFPWKAKDVGNRLEELRSDLATIRKEEEDWDSTFYEARAALWAGKLSETWERILSQEIVGLILAEGGLEVRPKMVRVMARFSDEDYEKFAASYSLVSTWTKRHDKSPLVNYVPPSVSDLANELQNVETWFKRVKKYKS